MSSFDHHPIETIRPNDRDKRRIIEEIKSRKPDGMGQTRGIRVTYNSACMTVSIANPGGNVVNYSVIPATSVGTVSRSFTAGSSTPTASAISSLRPWTGRA